MPNAVKKARDISMREESEVEVYVLLEKAEPSSAFHETWEAEKERRSTTSFSSANACFSFFFP